MKIQFALAIGFGFFAATASAQDERKCELRGTNEMVTLLLCPAGLSDEALATEGQIACDGRKPCGAWIWVNEADVPEAVPARHDELTAEAIQSSIAVWVNETDNLVTIRRSAK